MSGGRIRAFLQYINSHLSVLGSKILIGPGVADEMPYNVFGYDPALQFIQHVKYKQEILTFVGTLISENTQNLDLRDVKNASKLLGMCSVKIPFGGAYQICCDILRVSVLRGFCLIRKVPHIPTCVGTGCHDDTKTWNAVEAKSSVLHACPKFRHSLGQLELHLDPDCYMEHSDCAERKFIGEVGKLEDRNDVIDWTGLVSLWLEERSRRELRSGAWVTARPTCR